MATTPPTPGDIPTPVDPMPPTPTDPMPPVPSDPVIAPEPGAVPMTEGP